MSVINLVPEGLLSFFSSKTNGKNPNDLSSQVRGVMDLTAFYAATKTWKKDSASGQVTDATDSVVLTVPGTEAWFIYAIHGLMITKQAGDWGVALRIGGLFQNVSTVGVVFIAERYGESFAADERVIVTYAGQQPLVLRGGQTIEFFLAQNNPVAAAQAKDASVHVMALKLDV